MEYYASIFIPIFITASIGMCHYVQTIYLFTSAFMHCVCSCMLNSVDSCTILDEIIM